MKPQFGLSALAALLLVSGPASAVTEQDFMLETGQDLVDVCGVDASDPMYVPSIHFCHGFVAGTGHYHYSLTSGPTADPLFCLPEPRPTRSEVVSAFLQWASGEDLSEEAPVDALMRFAVAQYPCE
jgi:hypothetical protein